MIGPSRAISRSLRRQCTLNMYKLISRHAGASLHDHCPLFFQKSIPTSPRVQWTSPTSSTPLISMDRPSSGRDRSLGSFAGTTHERLQRSKIRDMSTFIGSPSDPHYDSQDDPLFLFIEDFESINQGTMNLLTDYMKPNTELHNIATYYYTRAEDHTLVSLGMPILISKSLKHHLYKNATLSEKQIKVLSLIELTLLYYLLHDDAIKRTKQRLFIPSANTRWDPYKVIMTSKMIYGITLNEVAKLGRRLTVSMCQMHESRSRGHFSTEEKRQRTIGYNLEQYFSIAEQKAGMSNYYLCKMIAQAAETSDFLANVTGKIMFHIGVFGQLNDDLEDVRQDLENGLATGAVLLAKQDYPVIEEMMMRQFRGERDVEVALELIEMCNARNRILAHLRNHSMLAMEHLMLIAESPYRNAMKAIALFPYGG